MKRLLGFFIIAVAMTSIPTIVSCGEDDIDPPTPQERPQNNTVNQAFSGTWFYTLTLEGNIVELAFNFGANGKAGVIVAQVYPSAKVFNYEGTWKANGNKATMTMSNGETYDFEYTNNKLYWVISASSKVQVSRSK